MVRILDPESTTIGAVAPGAARPSVSSNRTEVPVETRRFLVAVTAGLAVMPLQPALNSTLHAQTPTSVALTVQVSSARSANIRRVFVDDSTTPVTCWMGSNYGASIIKLEPLDSGCVQQSGKSGRRK
jgi:hypothetical protein